MKKLLPEEKKRNSKQVYITRTENEWALIRNKLVPNGESGQELKYLSLYIRRQVLKLKKNIEEVPGMYVRTGGKLKTKRPYVDTFISDEIVHIATQLKCSKETVIDRLIITPLLQSL